MLAEAAGGAASDGHQRIATIVPDSLHARSPLIIGSLTDVQRYEACEAEYGGV
jgi:fructose-1,6-bisphosphatase